MSTVGISSIYRSHHCNAISISNIDEKVQLSGWLHRKRHHGGLLFIDLRDHYGLTQCVVEPDNSFFGLVESLSLESVISVSGVVSRRPEDSFNSALATGEVELSITGVTVLSRSADLPLPVFPEADYPEDIRLRHRFIDLRRKRLHSNIIKRSKIISTLRKLMSERGFTEFQTPILTASSPEGARDFLVPSRLNPGKFYALPQAPQQFKQLFMIAGFDRYFQIAPCFRDEDARADRSPGEFYQLDIEMSFVEQQDVFDIVEPVLIELFQIYGNSRPVSSNFTKISYKESMSLYSTDKPDLRNPLKLCDVTDCFADSKVQFKAFRQIIEQGGIVRAIPAPGSASQPRSFFDKINDWARNDMKAAGLGYITYEQGENTLSAKGPIARFIPSDILQKIAKKAELKAGDSVFFACDLPESAHYLASEARNHIGDKLALIEKEKYEFCWIVDFPMYQYSEDAGSKKGQIVFSHNPFSMPQGGMDALENTPPLDILGYQYDIVCNGIELSSGAIRNHKPEILYKAFAIAGYDKEQVDQNFGGMIRALSYGAPPHGGIAPGLDRIVMLLTNENNLREVTAFPLNQQAQDLLMGAPGEVDEKHLRELSLALRK